MGDLVGIEPTPQNHETRVITIGPDDGPAIFPVPFFIGLFQKKIHCTRFPCLPLDTTVWEIVSLSTVKVLDACYRFLSTYTHTTVSQTVSLSTVKLFPVIEFLQLCAPVIDAMSYPPEQGRISLLTVKLTCTIKHTLVLI